MKGYCKMYIMRHGQTEGNVNRILQGHVDTPLTKEGIEQIKKRAENLRHVKFDAIFSSDLLRAKRTAQIIKLDRDLAVTTSKLLRERSYGIFDGKPSKEYQEKMKGLLEKRNQLPPKDRFSFKLHETIESNEELISRFVTFLREVAVAYTKKNVLIVSHGGTIKTFLIHLGWMEDSDYKDTLFHNTGFVELDSDGIDFFVRNVEGVEKA